MKAMIAYKFGITSCQRLGQALEFALKTFAFGLFEPRARLPSPAETSARLAPSQDEIMESEIVFRLSERLLLPSFIITRINCGFVLSPAVTRKNGTGARLQFPVL